MKNTVFPHKLWRPFLDCMPQLFFRPQYVWFPVHLKGHLIPLCYETLVVNWQNWLFTLLHQSRSVLSPNPIGGSAPHPHMISLKFYLPSPQNICHFFFKIDYIEFKRKLCLNQIAWLKNCPRQSGTEICRACRHQSLKLAWNYFCEI